MRLSTQPQLGPSRISSRSSSGSPPKRRGVGWNGLLVGDFAQARGGPMLTGHASHQVGLDADIWLTPMPSRELTRREREEMTATNVVRADKLDLDPNVWTPGHVEIIKATAQDPVVERILVNAAIKKRCAATPPATVHGSRRFVRGTGTITIFTFAWAVRKTSPKCKPQPRHLDGEGCGAELAYWFKPKIMRPAEPKSDRPRKHMTMSALPEECRQVLMAD